MRELKNFEKEMLSEGNIYTFARLVLELHESICKEANFTFSDAVNQYRQRTEFNDDLEKIYTLRGNGGRKYFFDAEMNFRGVKD